MYVLPNLAEAYGSCTIGVLRKAMLVKICKRANKIRHTKIAISILTVSRSNAVKGGQRDGKEENMSNIISMQCRDNTYETNLH